MFLGALFGSTKPVGVMYGGKLDDDSYVEYIAPSHRDAGMLLESHRANIFAVSTSLWRMLRPDPAWLMGKTQVPPYPTLGVPRMFIVDFENLFPMYAEKGVAKWWLNNFKKSKCNYLELVGAVARRHGLVLPVVIRACNADTLKLMLAFSDVLGYGVNEPIGWSFFSYHVFYDAIEGETASEKARLIRDNVPKHARQRISIIGGDLDLLNKIAEKIGTRVTVDFFDYAGKAKLDKALRTKEAKRAASTWDGSGTDGNTHCGMVLFDNKVLFKKEALLKEYIGNANTAGFNSILWDKNDA